MVSKKEIMGMFKPNNSVKAANSQYQGGVGFDNVRENIDPHIKTKVLDAKKINVNGDETGKAINTVGDLYISCGAVSPYCPEGGGITIESYDTGGFAGNRPYCRLMFNPEKRTLSPAQPADVILSAHKYHSDGSTHQHFSIYTSNAAGAATKRLNLDYLKDQALWAFPASDIDVRGYIKALSGAIILNNTLSAGTIISSSLISGAQVYSSGGFTGTGAYTNFTISGGIILAAS